jgi:arylsulfatase A-like enzyme
VTDHYHYWEDGGATYHTQFSSFEFVRGQEGDVWKGHIDDPVDIRSNSPAHIPQPKFRQDQINRLYMDTPEKQSQAVTFNLGMEFIRDNHQADNWYLQLETFDPHEPFFAHPEFKQLYPYDVDMMPEDLPLDWPDYKEVDEPEDYIQFMRYQYAALLSTCDHHLGRLLSLMDDLELWDDTLLIVCTDHGFLLGEHGWWGKARMPWYNALANTPLFIWDPRTRVQGERRSSLVQTIDLPATVLDFFGLDLPNNMMGRPLGPTIADDAPIRDYGLFGIFGGHINITDGRYVYMRGPQTADNGPLYAYTLLMSRRLFGLSAPHPPAIELSPPFTFTKGANVMKVADDVYKLKPEQLPTLLFDLETDPQQQQPINDPIVEQRLTDAMIQLMQDNDAPSEQYERLGLAAAIT